MSKREAPLQLHDVVLLRHNKTKGKGLIYKRQRAPFYPRPMQYWVVYLGVETLGPFTRGELEKVG